MRGQWGLILGIIAALLISVFAVINVEPVRVNYLFGIAEWPLILVILSSVLMGGVLVGAVGMIKVYRLQNEIKRLNKKEMQIESTLKDTENIEMKSVSKSMEEDKKANQ